MIPTSDERERRDAIARRVLDHIAENRKIALPDFDPALARPSDRFALVNVGLEPNDFAGTLGTYRYLVRGRGGLAPPHRNRRRRFSQRGGRTAGRLVRP